MVSDDKVECLANEGQALQDSVSWWSRCPVGASELSLRFAARRLNLYLGILFFSILFFSILLVGSIDFLLFAN